MKKHIFNDTEEDIIDQEHCFKCEPDLLNGHNCYDLHFHNWINSRFTLLAWGLSTIWHLLTKSLINLFYNKRTCCCCFYRSKKELKRKNFRPITFIIIVIWLERKCELKKEKRGNFSKKRLSCPSNVYANVRKQTHHIPTRKRERERERERDSPRSCG